MSERSVSLFDRGFSVALAFLLPGLITLFGLATVNPTVQTWFQGAQNGPTLVGFLFVLAAALALNLVITALRWFVFEQLPGPWLGCPWVKPPAASINLAERRLHDAVYVDLRHQFYYHYLAYANTAVAIPLAVMAWKFGSAPEPAWSTFLLVVAYASVATLVLGAAGCNAVRRFDERLEQTFGVKPAPSTPIA